MGLQTVAATCLGHLARIHGRLDSPDVVPSLRGMLADPHTGGAAENALEDIELFASDA